MSAPQALHSTTLSQPSYFQAVCWRAAVPASPAPWRCTWPSRPVRVSSHTVGVSLSLHDTRFLPPHQRCAWPQGWQVFLIPSGFMASLTQPAGFSASLAMRCFPWGKRISLFPAPSPRCHYLRSIMVFFASEAMRSALWAERFPRNCPVVLSTPKAIFPPPLSICFPLGRAGSLVPTSTLIVATCARSRFLHLQSDALPWSSGFSCIRLLAAASARRISSPPRQATRSVLWASQWFLVAAPWRCIPFGQFLPPWR